MARTAMVLATLTVGATGCQQWLAGYRLRGALLCLLAVLLAVMAGA